MGEEQNRMETMVNIKLDDQSVILLVKSCLDSAKKEMDGDPHRAGQYTLLATQLQFKLKSFQKVAAAALCEKHRITQKAGIREANNFVEHYDHLYTDSELSEKKMQNSTTFFINVLDGHLVDSFKKLAELARNGWAIGSIEDNVGNDGQYRFNIVRPKVDESL
jgi:hypothetical protein